MEGSSITHPSILDNGNYPYWKARMKVYKSVDEKDFALGEEYSNSKLVRKVLRSLSEKFFTKVTTIEEARYPNILKIDELIGSLQTFELNRDDCKNVKPKGERSIALQKKKKVLFASWSDDDTSSNSEFDEEQVNNFAAFTLSVRSGFEFETDDDFGRGFEKEFLNTYKTMQSK
ncbi:hypothetical protein CXB51_026619 [Gossypium anomalum]|uniref:Gag-pol polyprotein n=1 Tax=Gossypium anomalum TaxID=47600 RepID=A0A8J5YMZ7_9ROSI|nr:hypothetical protein CXB51_026619 [Gossypium anomalum]